MCRSLYNHQFLGREASWDAILKRVCAERCCIQLCDDARPELVELVNFTFNTVELGSMIVCGLPASPPEPVHESDARRLCYARSLTMPINPWLLTIPDVPYFQDCPHRIKIRRGIDHERKRQILSFECMAKKCTCHSVVTP